MKSPSILVKSPMVSKTTVLINFRVPDQENANGKEVGEEYWVMHDIIDHLLNIPEYELTEREAEIYNRADDRAEARKQRQK